MKTPTLQKVTLALVTEEATRHFVSDAARLGFPADAIPERLDTDLGTEAPLLYCGLDEEGTAIYRQKPKAQKAVALRVRNADPARDQSKAIDDLILQLVGLTETSAAVRAELSDKITAHEDAAICALVNIQSAPEAIQKGMLAWTLLSTVRAAPSHERVYKLRRYLQQTDAWLDAWRPNLESNPLRMVFNAAQYEAVKEIQRMVRAAIGPSTK